MTTAQIDDEFKEFPSHLVQMNASCLAEMDHPPTLAMINNEPPKRGRGRPRSRQSLLPISTNISAANNHPNIDVLREMDSRFVRQETRFEQMLDERDAYLNRRMDEFFARVEHCLNIIRSNQVQTLSNTNNFQDEQYQTSTITTLNSAATLTYFPLLVEAETNDWEEKQFVQQ